MKTRLLTGIIGAALMLTPLGFAQDDQKPSPAASKKATAAKRTEMSEDMRQAIEWERAKDRAAARQARIEARGSGTDRSADRVMDDKDPGKRVKDSKAPGAAKKQ